MQNNDENDCFIYGIIIPLGEPFVSWSVSTEKFVNDPEYSDPLLKH
jgi:hypothetical protein